MTKSSKTLWEIEPHTKAKHEILRRYLGAWFPILGSRIPRIVYLDGFCGPGRYSGGEDGSPIIALKEALRQPVIANSEIVFLFIDERPDRIAHLKTELSPTFAFIDPFGFKGAPFELVQRLLSNPRTEVFINLMIDSVNRFVEHPSPIDRQHIKDLLGASETEISRVINSQRVFLKSLWPSFLYTDFTENTEKGRFLKDFSVKLRVIRVVRVLKRSLRNSHSGSYSCFPTTLPRETSGAC